MTLPEMNVHVVKNSLVLSALCLGGAVLLSACAFDPVTDPSSTIDGRIDSLVAGNASYPKWSDFPAKPEPMPAASYIQAEVQKLELADARLTQEVASVDWQLDGNAENFVNEVRAKMAQIPVEAPTAESVAEVDSYAERLRARAMAPPPVDRPLR